jgi:hypothetical protein
MPSDIVSLSNIDAEVLKQWLNALVITVKATEEKAAIACRRVLSARQLHDEEQATAADHERQAATKKLVPRSTSFSTTETATASLSYVDTIIANLHIQADTMMEEIHLDTSGPAAALMAFYSNKTLSTPLSPPRPPGKNNGSNPAMVTAATTTGIGTTIAATAVVAARMATMVEIAVATPPATPTWFPTVPPPTTAGLPSHG